jgi:23S rRNA (cytosine1962-C5)-methyltransferase
MNDYELLDSGAARKLERFGDVIVSRPCAQAVWDMQRPDMWASRTASFDREQGWQARGSAELPSSWVVTINDIALRLAPTPAGHLGVFPETRELWGRITEGLSSRARGASVLNLFAYSGGATLAAARAGCAVCHVDASRSMVTRARENAALNQLEDAPIRWIIEDVSKFLGREIRRGRTYDAIMLDRDLVTTLEQCAELLSERPAFVILTSHTQGVTPERLGNLLVSALGPGEVTSGEMELTGAGDVRSVGSGVWMQWAPRRGRDTSE